ncbi:hypothetical protein [Mesorhizobium sp.]|nr:hypothetical protein [Mesorhizobium sp.]
MKLRPDRSVHEVGERHSLALSEHAPLLHLYDVIGEDVVDP